MKNDKKDALIQRQVDALGIPPIEMFKAELAREERKEAHLKLLLKVLICVALSAAAIILITNLLVTVLQIEGISMHPLLEANEIVIALKTDNPDRNDIIAFNHNNQLHVKRVIAIAGDKVVIDENGVVSVNSQKLDEPYVTELSLGVCNIEFPFHVPAGTVFVLGDNREQSMDSRDSEFGVIRKDQIIGRVTFSIWPLPRFGGVK